MGWRASTGSLEAPGFASLEVPLRAPDLRKKIGILKHVNGPSRYVPGGRPCCAPGGLFAPQIP